MYRDDDHARAERAHALIGEIADLERQKVAQSTVEQRLEAARRELAGLQAPPALTPATTPPERPPGLVAHVVVFAVTAVASAVGYSLLV